MMSLTASMRGHFNPPGHPGEWLSLRLLNSYRVFVALVLLITFFLGPAQFAVGRDAPFLFYVSASAYLVAGLAFALALRLRRPGSQVQAYLQFYTDIVALTCVSYASGGVESGLAIMLLVPVAAAGMLLPARESLVYAALATVLILTMEVVRHLDLGATAPAYPRAALLGAMMFAAAVLAGRLARRSAETEELARQRSADLEELARLNEEIIQQMESGIVVTAADGTVRLANASARALLGAEATRPGADLAEVAPGVEEARRQWLAAPEAPLAPVRPRSSAQQSVQPGFTALGGDETLISIEDAGFIEEKLQQLKLASLGRLTASIAHEIRNPLGAISHSAQLLAESEHLDSGDRRLIDIQLEHCRRVNGIVENILQLSRRRGLTRSTIELVDWCESFRDEFLHQRGLDPQRLVFEGPEGPVRIQFDPDHLRQVVDNLCQNAIDHGRTSEGGPVAVRLELEGPRDGIVRLDVVDDGIPIAAERLEEIFEPFYTTSHAGTGLGLFLARELCGANGAQLHYRRQEAGNRFQLALEPGAEENDG